jgi:hypothetical protein
MATIEKTTADEIIRNELTNSRKVGDSTCLRIVRFESYYGGIKYGAIFDGMDLLSYHNSNYCDNVEIYWENPMISFKNIYGKYLILRPNKLVSASEVRKLTNAETVISLQIACEDACDFCEVLGDAYMSVKNSEFYSEEIQIFKIVGEANSTELFKKYQDEVIGAIAFEKQGFSKLKRNQYTKCQNIQGRDRCHSRVKELIKDSW